MPTREATRPPVRGGRAGVVRALVATVALLAAGCTAGGGSTPGATGPANGDPTAGTAPVPSAPAAAPLGADDEQALAAQLAAAPGCDPLDARACLLPFPSDRFTVPDPSSASGRRVAFTAAVMPKNAAGTPIDPAGWNGNDGFSPGTPMVASLPGVDLVASRAPAIDDVAASLEPDSSVVVVDLDTGERVPVWAEADADSAAAEEQVVIVRPARNLAEGHRHAVGFVGLVDGEGHPVQPTIAFRAYRDNRTTDLPEIEDQRPAMEEALTGLAAAGVDRSTLTLAWGFTVASADNIAGPLLSMRDQALAAIGTGAPAFAVTAIEQGPDAKLHDGIDRVVHGTYEVPLFLTGAGEPGSVRNAPDAAGVPTRNGTLTAGFTCQVAARALAEPARPMVYGHGLLGSRDEVTSGHVAATAAANNMVYCATDWIGMSTADLPNTIGILADLSKFPQLADRSMQGILDTVVLGRLVRSADGLGRDPAFQDADGRSVIAAGEAYYDGNSQGGIMGGAATAVSTEWTRAVLGVPGMNYSTLLRRSTDFVGGPGEPGFEDVLVPAYPDVVERAFIYGLLQMLWDRAEVNGYAAHLTDDPLPGTPAHRVLLHVAFGDHQVADITPQVLARTARIPLRAPALADGRRTGDLWGLDPVSQFPSDGSMLVYWDSGTLPAPQRPISPVESDEYRATCAPGADGKPPRTDACEDPHEDPRRQPAAIAQKDAFLREGGQVVDICDGRPCTATPRYRL